MGAADYIKKPFSQKLLNERVRTVLRIYTNRSTEGFEKNNNVNSLIKGDLTLDEDKQLCFGENRNRINCS